MFFLALGAFVTGTAEFKLPLVVWLCALLLSTFVIAPVPGWSNTPVLMILVLLPCMALTAGRFAFQACFLVMTMFAGCLVYQYFFDPSLMYHGRRAAWPMLNPNNAATLMAACLVTSVAGLDRNRRFINLMFVILFLGALLVTQSRGGVIAALVGLAGYFAASYPEARKPAGLAVIGGMFLMMLWPRARTALMERFPIWEVTMPEINLQGYGIGTFFKHYREIRTEQATDGFFVHNDFLQFAFEMGWPVAVVFALVCFSFLRKINYKNASVCCSFLTVLTHSLVSFPLYLPAICLFSGVLLSRIDGKR